VKRPRPPPDLDAPFREADAKIAARVASGELPLERAEAIAAGGRLLAFTNEYRGTIRRREGVAKEMRELGEVHRALVATEHALADLVDRWAKLHADRLHAEREAVAAATRREDRAARLAAADDARRAHGLPVVGPIDRGDDPDDW
jgi:hypothetical protein